MSTCQTKAWTITYLVSNQHPFIASQFHDILLHVLVSKVEGAYSLDSLFSDMTDPIRRYLLDWKKREEIIEGITQGLLYLQEYSRLTIIHRDLKASNILLDGDMKAKISDFGMARIFAKDEHEANTDRLVGT